LRMKEVLIILVVCLSMSNAYLLPIESASYIRPVDVKALIEKGGKGSQGGAVTIKMRPITNRNIRPRINSNIRLKDWLKYYGRF